MKKIIIIICVMLAHSYSFANGISVTNLSTTYTASTNKLTINFDLSWENSWRNSFTKNWDAGWVFFKFNNGGQWMHLDLTGNDITIPTGFTYHLPSDKKGLMIYRDTFGSGNVSITGCKVGINPRWGEFDIKAFAIEMVYIPKDSFYLGDGYSGSTNKFSDGNISPYNPYKVTSNTLTFGSSAGQLYDPISGFSGTLPSTFPNGYDSFYVMKYEMTLGAARDFINCLTLSQQYQHINYTGNPLSGAGTLFNSIIGRNYMLEIDVPGNAVNNSPAIVGTDGDGDNIRNEANDGEYHPYINAGTQTYAAYLDWAGLRPFTELEYEKICRGPVAPVPGEYAWGSSGIQTSSYTYSGLQTDSEKVTTAVTAGMAVINLSFGALRNGVFANATSNRAASGAAYYGVMEMTGNTGELTVTPLNANSRVFTGLNGDGSLWIDGRANTDFWPCINAAFNGTGVVNGAFSTLSIKGGYFEVPSGSYSVSARTNIVNNFSYAFFPASAGVRGARSIR